MPEASEESAGRMVAAMVASSWRRDPVPLECSRTELEKFVPLLLSSGAAALGWWRVQGSGLRDVPAARGLHEAYRLNTIQAAINQQSIKKVIALLRSAEIEPILVKGWAAARAYPEQGMRPYGDIDLCVRPDEFASAESVLKSLADPQYEIDLHKGFAKFGGGSADGFYARSRLVCLDETEVRVLGFEDHLRFLCIHMLREGAWRPLWLCDIAAAIEARPANFDWDRCLSGNSRLADWVICAITLAQQLLGADITGIPVSQNTRPLPGWVTQTILKEWGAELPFMTKRYRRPMIWYLDSPGRVLDGFRHRWPNAIEATISVSGNFNRMPRLPYQISTYLARSVKFGLRIPKLLREHHSQTLSEVLPTSPTTSVVRAINVQVSTIDNES